MNSLLRCFLVSLTLASASAHAQQEPTPSAQSATPPKRPAKKSLKKSHANAVHLAPPQVLEEGDVDLGLRASEGGIYNGAPVMATTIEKMLKPNFGLGGILGYSHYSTELAAGPVTAEMDSTVWTIAVVGSFHADLFKVKNLDTFASVGLGHAFINTNVSSNFGLYSPSVSAGAATDFLIAYLNARYFIDSTWAFTTSLGTGLGTISIGGDYLF